MFCQLCAAYAKRILARNPKLVISWRKFSGILPSRPLQPLCLQAARLGLRLLSPSTGLANNNDGSYITTNTRCNVAFVFTNTTGHTMAVLSLSLSSRIKSHAIWTAGVYLSHAETACNATTVIVLQPFSTSAAGQSGRSSPSKRVQVPGCVCKLRNDCINSHAKDEFYA